MVARWGEPEDLDQLAWAVIRTIELYREQNRPATRVTGFSWDLRYGEVPNSHDAPIRGQTNWGRKSGLPTSYPGWSGRVWIRYADDNTAGVGSSPFQDTLTYPGTGGWGSYSGPFDRIATARFRRYSHTHDEGSYPEPQIYSWDYRFFESDWPAVEQWQQRRDIVALLRGSNMTSHLRHRFEWHDPEILARDREFMLDRATIYAMEKDRQYAF
jgi:hypothetical protein